MRNLQRILTPDTVAVTAADRFAPHNLRVTICLAMEIGLIEVFATSASSVRYDAKNLYQADCELSCELEIPHLNMILHSRLPVWLHLCDRKSGAELFDPVDILAAVVRGADEMNRPMYGNQPALDAQNCFDLTIALTPWMGVSVLTVNGYIIR